MIPNTLANQDVLPPLDKLTMEPQPGPKTSPNSTKFHVLLENIIQRLLSLELRGFHTTTTTTTTTTKQLNKQTKQNQTNKTKQTQKQQQTTNHHHHHHHQQQQQQPKPPPPQQQQQQQQQQRPRQQPQHQQQQCTTSDGGPAGPLVGASPLNRVGMSRRTFVTQFRFNRRKME